MAATTVQSEFHLFVMHIATHIQVAGTLIIPSCCHLDSYLSFPVGKKEIKQCQNWYSNTGIFVSGGFSPTWNIVDIIIFHNALWRWFSSLLNNQSYSLFPLLSFSLPLFFHSWNLCQLCGISTCLALNYATPIILGVHNF